MDIGGPWTLARGSRNERTSSTRGRPASTQPERRGGQHRSTPRVTEKLATSRSRRDAAPSRSPLTTVTACSPNTDLGLLRSMCPGKEHRRRPADLVRKSSCPLGGQRQDRQVVAQRSVHDGRPVDHCRYRAHSQGQGSRASSPGSSCPATGKSQFPASRLPTRCHASSSTFTDDRTESSTDLRLSQGRDHGPGPVIC